MSPFPEVHLTTGICGNLSPGHPSEPSPACIAAGQSPAAVLIETPDDVETGPGGALRTAPDGRAPAGGDVTPLTRGSAAPSREAPAVGDALGCGPELPAPSRLRRST